MSDTFINIIGLVAGTCTSCAIIPQVVKTYKKKTAEDVSILMFIVLLTGNFLWIFYGVSKQELPIILTNIVTSGLNITMLVFKVKFKDNG